MSVQRPNDDQRGQLGQGAATDVFITRFANPHTAIPDWLIIGSKIRLELRHMAAVIIIMSKGGVPPTKDEIAEVLGVTPRTVQRWLAELGTAGVMSFQLVGRRRMYVFHEPCTISDPAITDPAIRDRMRSGDRRITDRWYSQDRRSGSAIHGGSTRMNGDSSENPITDRSGGGGDHDHVGDSKLPQTNAATGAKATPDAIQTETGRWLVRMGFNITSAARFQSIPLAIAQRDYERRRELGQRNGAIVQAWAVEHPALLGQNDESEPTVSADRRAELTARYGDLFLFSGDVIDEEKPE